jgi:DNA polymerase III delta subunit
MGLSWKKPPPVVVIGGTEDFLVQREVNRAMRIASSSGITLEITNSIGEVSAALEFSTAFGTPTLIITGPSSVSPDLVVAHQEAAPNRVCLLVVVPAAVEEEKFPFLAGVPGGYIVEHNRPTKKAGKAKLAARFAQAEAAALLKFKGALSGDLAEAIVGAVGDDLGVVAFEISKASALARHRGETSISTTLVRATIRPNQGVELGPLRDSMRARNPVSTAAALRRIKIGAGAGDPLMLLLRARGGPADLALSWYQATLLKEGGADIGEICGRMSLPKWIVEKDLLPAIRRWDSASLRRLIKDLARVERGVFEGAPSPWIACETALLRACSISQ